MSNLDNRSRNKDGRIHAKRGDTKIETLKQTYPEFEGINGNMHLDTLKERLNVDSLDEAIKVLRKSSND